MLFTITFAKLPPDVLAVGKPINRDLEIVLDKGRYECTDSVARSWRDRALAAVGKHLVEMLVVADELGGEGHEVEPFVVSQRQACVQSALEDLSLVGVAGRIRVIEDCNLLASPSKEVHDTTCEVRELNPLGGNND
jgi:hypothetical protein